MLITRFALTQRSLLLETAAQAAAARKLLSRYTGSRCPLLAHLLAAVASEAGA
jgi:hypothetical protein